MYVISAVISLPGDAFQRSQARVKTSFIVLEKRVRVPELEEQPSIFMYACRYVGLDDPKRTRWMPGDDELHQKAIQEVETVVREYQAFREGHGDARYIVPADQATGRLDVKHCLRAGNWLGEKSTGLQEQSALSSRVLSDVAELKVFNSREMIDCMQHERHEQILTVRYDGTACAGNIIFPRTETKYPELYRVREGEIVISNIAATHGSVTVVPPEMDGMVVSKEYTVLRARDGYDARVISAVLRSPQMRAKMLLRSTGANRTRIRWAEIRNLDFPYPETTVVRRFIGHIEEAEAARMKAKREIDKSEAELDQALRLNRESAEIILDAFRPPR